MLPLVVDLEKILGKVAELLVGLGSDGPFVQSDVVGHPCDIALVDKVEIGAFVIQSHLVLGLELRDEGGLVALTIEEFGKSVSGEAAEQFVLPLGG